ncbi:hypothetical protein D3C86_1400490 [compost metagenome]
MNKQATINILQAHKDDPDGNRLCTTVDGETFDLVPLGSWALARPELIKLIADWRAEHSLAFPSIFKVTFDGTRKWFEKRVIEDPERILFAILDRNGCMVGHIGVATFDWVAGDCEIDNVMRGDSNISKGLMTSVTNTLVKFMYEKLGAKTVSLRVFGDNWRAIALYNRCGFTPYKSTPMSCEFNDAGITWKELPTFDPQNTNRIFLKMRHISKKGPVT